MAGAAPQGSPPGSLQIALGSQLGVQPGIAIPLPAPGMPHATPVAAPTDLLPSSGDPAGSSSATTHASGLLASTSHATSSTTSSANAQATPDGEDMLSDITSMSSTVIYNHEELKMCDQNDGFELVLPSKRRRSTKRSHLVFDRQPHVSSPKHNLTVIIKPVDAKNVITRFNPLTLKDAFEKVLPDSVLQVRPNHRLNLLALDTRNAAATERFLKVSTVGGIAVRAYEPRPKNCGVGVIKEVPVDLSNSEILEALRQRVPVISARRLGEKSENVRIVFCTETTPEHVILGYTRYRVYEYHETPRQCTKCQRYGHVASVCRLSQRCPRCGGDHERSACATENLRCANCGRTHESTDSHCSVRQKEKAIYRLKTSENIDYMAAKAALQKPRHYLRKDAPASARNASKHTGVNTTPSKLDVQNFPPLSPPQPQQARAEQEATIPTQGPGMEPPKPAPRRRPKQSRDQSAHPSSTTNVFHLMGMILGTLRNFLTPPSSPVAHAILTLIDLVSPIFSPWR